MSELQFNHNGYRYFYIEHYGEPFKTLSAPYMKELFIIREDKPENRLYLQYNPSMKGQMTLQDWLAWCATQYEKTVLDCFIK